MSDPVQPVAPNRRLLEVLAGVAAGVLAAVTVRTVPFSDLGPWAFGTLGPLVVLGIVVGVLSWPWQRGELAGPEPVGRQPWRLLYLVPVVPVLVVAPLIIRDRLGGMAPAAGLAIFFLVAYTALLGGLAIFLVVVLPLGILLGSLSLGLQGRRVSPYVPLGALLILSIVGLVGAGSVALDGLGDDTFDLLFVLVQVVGGSVPGVTVRSTGWLLVSRISGVLLLATAIGFVLAGRDRPGDDWRDLR